MRALYGVRTPITRISSCLITQTLLYWMTGGRRTNEPCSCSPVGNTVTDSTCDGMAAQASISEKTIERMFRYDWTVLQIAHSRKAGEPVKLIRRAHQPTRASHQ